MEVTDAAIKEQYLQHLGAKSFPCVAARASISANQVHCMVAQHMACPNDDKAIVAFLYNFIEDYRSTGSSFNSAAVIFKGPQMPDEASFDALLWQRLQALSNIDAANCPYDDRISADPTSENFSFSIGREGFYIVGLHPQSSRKARRFPYPVLVFNPHAQFEELRTTERYQRMKQTIRKRDEVYSGSVNPMLTDFGTASEVFQYSGRQYGADWHCPLKINHANTNTSAATSNHSAS